MSTDADLQEALHLYLVLTNESCDETREADDVLREQARRSFRTTQGLAITITEMVLQQAMLPGGLLR